MLGCFNKRVLIGLGVAALAILAVSPRLFGAALPLLIIAACPLSMVLMMRSMNRSRDHAGGSSMSGCGTPSGRADSDAQVRELQEEVNRLRAELRLRGEDRTV
jgi:hypothetical protein